MKKMLGILITLFLVAVVVYVAGCTDKITATENNTQGALEQVTTAVTPTSGMQISDQDTQIIGFFIEFGNGTTEPEVKTILENYNMTMNYTIYYNSNIMPKRYYIKVDKDKRMNVKNELRMEENWTNPSLEYPEFGKGNYYIITIPEQIIHDKIFSAILEKNNLQLNKSVWCIICFENNPRNWLWSRYVIGTKHELEMNEKILTVETENIMY